MLWRFRVGKGLLGRIVIVDRAWQRQARFICKGRLDAVLEHRHDQPVPVAVPRWVHGMYDDLNTLGRCENGCNVQCIADPPVDNSVLPRGAAQAADLPAMRN